MKKLLQNTALVSVVFVMMYLSGAAYLDRPHVYISMDTGKCQKATDYRDNAMPCEKAINVWHEAHLVAN